MIAIFVCCTRFPDTISYNVGILRMSITAVVTVSSFILCIFVGFEMTCFLNSLIFIHSIIIIYPHQFAISGITNLSLYKRKG